MIHTTSVAGLSSLNSISAICPYRVIVVQHTTIHTTSVSGLSGLNSISAICTYRVIVVQHTMIHTTSVSGLSGLNSISAICPYRVIVVQHTTIHTTSVAGLSSLNSISAICAYRVIVVQHTTWFKCYWSEVDASEILTGTEKQLELVTGLPTKLVQGWDIYQFLTQEISAIQVTVPLAEGLKRYGVNSG